MIYKKSNAVSLVKHGVSMRIYNDMRDCPQGDVVIVPPGRRFYFRGNLKQVCVTAPAWEERYEHHVRDIAIQ